jgi:hypothetical protein
MTRSLQSSLEELLGSSRISFRGKPESIVAPVESTARYRYRQIPPWQMYVSSTLQEPLVGFNFPPASLVHLGCVALHHRQTVV